ncbi:MAG TPA: CoA pyrophosphatase [Deltaproteobacteria bacterium]|nr:CoA pyrophosphatase [Deltaproteobacteria bacterium]
MDNGSLHELLADETGMKTRIRTLLHERDRRFLPPENLRKSAVLIPLIWEKGEPQIIVTKRSMDVEHHKGEISFPGGRAEECDGSHIQTALREAQEEIALDPEDVEVLGMLDDHISILGYHITPVVGAVPYPYEFRINSEAETLLKVSLRYSLRNDVWMAENSTFMGRSLNIYFLEIKGGVVWGATARMLKHFVDLIAGHPRAVTRVSRMARGWVEDLLSKQNQYRDVKR